MDRARCVWPWGGVGAGVASEARLFWSRFADWLTLLKVETMLKVTGGDGDPYPDPAHPSRKLYLFLLCHVPLVCEKKEREA